MGDVDHSDLSTILTSTVVPAALLVVDLCLPSKARTYDIRQEERNIAEPWMTYRTKRRMQPGN